MRLWGWRSTHWGAAAQTKKVPKAKPPKLETSPTDVLLVVLRKEALAWSGWLERVVWLGGLILGATAVPYTPFETQTLHKTRPFLNSNPFLGTQIPFTKLNPPSGSIATG